MIASFRIPAPLLAAVRRDLTRPHPFAHERVGFVASKAAFAGPNRILVCTVSYHSVADGDYVDDPSVGAMMGPAAIRAGLELGLNGGAQDISVFHLHSHGHRGIPWFSRVDLRESAKFVPDFFNVAPRVPHGVLVLSDDGAAGLVWVARDRVPVRFAEVVGVGAPLELSSGQ